MYDDIKTAIPSSQGDCNSQADRIVDYLIRTLRIPEDDQLVNFFGSGAELSNREAMMTWIHSLSHEYDADEAEHRLAKLVLHAQLETFEISDGVL